VISLWCHWHSCAINFVECLRDFEALFEKILTTCTRGSGEVLWWKKTSGRKSRVRVPLRNCVNQKVDILMLMKYSFDGICSACNIYYHLIFIDLKYKYFLNLKWKQRRSISDSLSLFEFLTILGYCKWNYDVIKKSLKGEKLLIAGLRLSVNIADITRTTNSSF
jgi:hypothetical protein